MQHTRTHANFCVNTILFSFGIIVVDRVTVTEMRCIPLDKQMHILCAAVYILFIVQQSTVQNVAEQDAD